MASTLGKINPFRYRGYVYDEETGLYYLKSRYYRAEFVRFLNADIYVSTGQGLLDGNMFTYCLNSPVFQHDTTGTLTSTLTHASEADLDHTDDDERFGGAGGAGAGGTGGVGRASGGISKTRVHGNSKLSTRQQHGYEIYNIDTKDVVKTGISGQTLNKNGTSPRANSQVNHLNASVGANLYSARIFDLVPSREMALEWERRNALRLWNEGNSMSIHSRPRPWEN